MIRFLPFALVAAMGASMLAPATAFAKPADGKREPRIVVTKATPKYRGGGPNGFLPGYRQPLPLAEWRDRAPRYGGGDFTDPRRRYISGYAWRYGWGGPGYYRGRYNGGGFGPCWNNTPIGPMWNCGM